MHPGLQLASAMWALVALALALVGLRLYVRVRLVKFVGVEDYAYVATGIFFLCFVALIQVAAGQGFGGSGTEMPSNTTLHAVYIADTMAIIANAGAKLSMGLFLLRIVHVAWHKVTLWCAPLIMMVLSSVLVIVLWTKIGVSGEWTRSITSMTIVVGSWSVVCDFFFGVFPWVFIWSLHMSRQGQIVLAGAMSLGVIAGVFGIVKTVDIARMDTDNYKANFVQYFALVGAEIFVSMGCVGLQSLWTLCNKTHEEEFQSAKALGANRNERGLPQFEMDLVLDTDDRRHADSSFVHSRVDSVHTGPSKPSTPSSASILDRLSLDQSNKSGIWVRNEIQVSESVAEWPLRR